MIVGVFIFLGAQAEAQFTQSKSLLRGLKVKDALMRDYQTIESTETIKRAVELLLNGQHKSFLITSNQKPVGTLNRDEIIKALAETGETEMIANIMNKNLVILEANSALDDIYLPAQLNKASLMLVVENNQPIGTLIRKTSSNLLW